ncbi:MAG: hypothetical protein BYD32DRAFT_77270 [Podila humilis]|nr:MAG: hypothetical protein BYD32DRAFT_77270 [Podila humilis]
MISQSKIVNLILILALVAKIQLAIACENSWTIYSKRFVRIARIVLACAVRFIWPATILNYSSQVEVLNMTERVCLARHINFAI